MRNENKSRHLTPGGSGDREPEIWAIGGGKGGSGKSFLTSLLGICLAEQGKKLVLIDADYGGANLHSFLGIEKPKYSLTDFFDSKIPLDDIVTPTKIPNLRLVMGDVHVINPQSIKHSQKLKLFRHIKGLDAELILMDLGAGSSLHTVDTYLLADRMISMTTPQTISFDNLYHFLNKVLFRKLNIILDDHGLKRVTAEAWKQRGTAKIKSIKQFVDYLSGFSDEIKPAIERELSDFMVHVVINYVRKKEQIQTGASLGDVLKDFYGIGATFAGAIHYYDDIWQYNNRFYPLFKSDPSMPLFDEVRAILTQIENVTKVEAHKEYTEEILEETAADIAVPDVPGQPVTHEAQEAPEVQKEHEEYEVHEIQEVREIHRAPTVKEPVKTHEGKTIETVAQEPVEKPVEAVETTTVERDVYVEQRPARKKRAVRDHSGPISIFLIGDTNAAVHAMKGEKMHEITTLPFNVGRMSKGIFGNILKKNDFYFAEEPPYSISREHFSITEHAGQFYFKDRGSKLGTIVNQVHVGGKEYRVSEAPLHMGRNSIMIGHPSTGLWFTILLKEA
jgi:flagellar biosynthesis protein FlhG